MHIRTSFSFAAATLGLGALSTAMAGPTGGTVVGGQGTISAPSSTTTVIDQASQNLQVNWNTFNVAANENVQFHQPSSSAVAYNRILDQNPSQIFGRIDANGQVVLVNPNGLLIGRTAQLNTNSLVVSSLDAIDFDAASGRYRFSTNRLDPGAVINEGSITAGPGGSVTLLGGRVSNVGSIVADYGTVNLAAGRAATLDLAGDGLLRLEVGADLLSNGSGAVAAVENSGNIQANGGQVLLTANAVRDVFANLVNNSGVVRANRIDNTGGTIRLMGPEGTVLSSGTLDASAGDAVSTGGSVSMLGERVGLMGNAVVDVSGATGGGTALIGGDYQGKNPDVLNAQRTFVSTDATLNADAGTTGDGGRVIVWADDITRFGGKISARGGLAGGDGGFAEVSGKQSLAFAGTVDMTAAHGASGELLLDPDDIIIVAGSGDPGINGSTGVLAFADVTTPDPAIIGADTITSLLATTDVTLQAENSLNQTSGTVGPVVSSHTLTLESHGTMRVTNLIGGGGLTLNADSNLMLAGAIATNNAPVTARSFNGTLTLASNATIVPGTGTVNLRAQGAVAINGQVLANGADLTVTSDAGAITMGNGSVLLGNGDKTVTMTAAGNVTVADVEVHFGTISIESLNGNILNDASSSTYLDAANVTLRANGTNRSVGSGSNAIDTTASTLVASADNGVFIHEQDGVTLGDINGNAGAVSINAASIAVGANRTVQVAGGASPITLTSGGGIVMNAGSTLTTNAGTGTITLSAGGSGNVAVENIATAGQVSISATGGSINDTSVNSRTSAAALTLRGANIGNTNGLDIDATTLDAEAGSRLWVIDHGGALTLNNLSAGVLGATVTADGPIGFGTNAVVRNLANGPTSLTSNIGTIAMNQDTLIDGGSGAVSLKAAGGVTVGDLRALGGSVSVTSDFGDIDHLVGKQIETGGLTLSAVNGRVGTPGSKMETKVTSLKASAFNGVYIDEQDADVTLDTITAGIGGFDLNAVGDVVVGAGKLVSTTGAPILVTSTNGAITMGSASEFRSGAANTTLNAQGAITLAKVTTTGTGAVSVTSTAGGIDVATGGSEISLGSGTASLSGHDDVKVSKITTTAGSNVSITSTNGSIVDDTTANTVIQANQLTLSANTGHIGTSNTNEEIDTDATSLSASAAHGAWIGDAGAVTVTQLAAGDTGAVVTAHDALTLGVGVAATTSNAPITFRSTNDAFSMDTGSSISAGSGAVTVAANGNVDVRDITTTGAASITSTTGNIANTAGTIIKAGALTLSANGGQIGDSAPAGEIDTDVTSLKASALNGVYVSEANDLALDDVSGGNAAVAIGAGGAVSVLANRTVQTTNAPISIFAVGGLSMGNASTFDAGNGTVTLHAGGDIRVSRIATAGNASITSTGGNILDDTTANTVVQANNLTLSAASGKIGDSTSAADAIDTDASSLSASSAHGAWINDVGALTVTHLGAGDAAVVLTAQNALTLAAAATVATTNAPISLSSTAGTFTMGTGSSISAGSGAIALAANGNVALENIVTSGNASITSTTGNITNTAGTTIQANVLTLTATAGAIGGSGGGLELDTNVASLEATAAHGVRVTELDAVTLDDVAAGDGGFALNAGGGIALGANKAVTATNAPVALTASAGGISMASGSSIAAGSGAVTLNASGDVGVTNITTTGTASITSTAGNIVDDSAQGTLIRANGLQLSAASGAIGGSAANADIDTQVATLDALAGNGVYVHEINGVTLKNVSTAAGNVAVISDTGDILVNAVSAPDQVTLAATAGAITDDDNDFTVIAGTNGVSLSAGTGIGTITTFQAALGSSIDVQTNGALSAVVASNTGQINLNILGAPTLATGAITLGSGTGRGGEVLLAYGNDLNLAGLAPGAINIGAGNTTSVGFVSAGTLTLPSGGGFTDAPAAHLLVYGAGDVVDNDANPRELSFTADALTFNSGGLGGATVLNTNVNRLDATLAGSQNLTINEVDGIALGTITDGNANLIVNAGGAISDGGSHLTANGVTLSGTSIGAPGAEIETSALTLDATASAGGIFVREQNDLGLTAHATGGAVDVLTQLGSLTVMSATGTGVTLTSGAGDLSLLGAVDGGSGPVNLTASDANGAINLASTVSTTGDATFTAGASGAIVTSGPASHVTARNLTVTGSAIGNGSQRLNTTVDSLTATASNGGIFVTEDDALSLNATATGGAVEATTSDGSITVSAASGNGITLFAGGDGNAIVVNGAVNGGAGDIAMVASGAGGQINFNDTVSTTGNVFLEAGSAAARGAITSNGGHIAGNLLMANAASIGSGAAPLNTAVNTLTAIATNGGIYVQEADALDLLAAATGPVQVSTLSGALNASNVSGDGVNLVAGGAGSDLTVSTAVNGGSGVVALTAGNNMTLDGVVGSAGNVVLTTSGADSTLTLNSLVAADQLTITVGPANARGAIVAGAANQLVANGALLRAASMGTGTERLNTSFGSLDAQASDGSLFVDETDALTLNATAANGSVDVRTAGGPLTVASAISNGGDVTLRAGGAIVAAANSNVAGNAVSLAGSSIGSSTARVNTTATSLNATSTNGGAFINEADGVTLTGNATGGALDVQAAGPLTVASAAGDGVTLSTSGAGANIAVNGTVNAGNGVALTTNGAGANIAVNGTVNAGSGVALTTAGAGANIAVNDAVNAGTGALTLAANGAGSGIALNGALSTSGTATLTAGSSASRGAITAGAGGRISAASLTATGSGIGTSGARLDTTVGSLNATSTNGGTFVTETDALTLTANATGGALDVQAGGPLTVASAAGDSITLTTSGAGANIAVNGSANAGAGALTIAANGAGSGIAVNGALTTSGAATLTAGSSGSRGAITAGAAGQITAATLTATGSSIGSASGALNTSIDTLNASASTGDVYIREQNGIRLADVRAGGNVDIGASSGNITVNSVNAAGDLSLAAGNGAIADDGDDSTRLAGRTVTLLARSIGAPSTLSGAVLDSKSRLDIDATNLDATSTAGGIFIDSRNGLASTSLHAGGGADGDIELLVANGDLNLLSVSASDTLLLSAARNIYGLPSLGTITARAAELRAGGGDASEGHIGTVSQPLSLNLEAGNTLRMFVPQTVDPNDLNRAPSTLPSPGVTSTLSLFAAPSALALQAGFGQFQSLSDTQFTSPAEALVRSIQNQTATVQSVLGLDWASFDPNVSLFGTLDPSVCLPGDQRDEEESATGC